MADVITTLHPEGVQEDNLYPNIKKENLPSDLQPVADFALSEYEKTLNLINGIFTDGQAYAGTGNTYSDPYAKSILVELEPNKEYALNNGVYSWVNEYDSAKNFLRQKNALGTFTTSSDCVFVGLTYPISENAMLNYGSTVSPYQPYNGAVMHDINVKGVLLWKNGNPSASFANQRVTITSLSGYSTIAVEFSLSPNDETSVIVFSKTGSGSVSFVADVYVGRSFEKVSDTVISFLAGYRNGAENNARAIPLAIYGIK